MSSPKRRVAARNRSSQSRNEVLKWVRAGPRYSIGVTTYNRPVLLKETLRSILAQTFEDFEVIVGNDYVTAPISAETLGIHDVRIRIINHSTNLGEIKNMNAILAASTGAYFTWLADDDCYLPGFLAATHAAIESYPAAECIYTAHHAGEVFSPYFSAPAAPPEEMAGAEFVDRFMRRTITPIGCYGMIRTTTLKRLGGATHLGRKFAIYSDTLLAIQAGRLQRVVYNATPLIFYRTHAQSQSWVSPDLEVYATAHVDLVNKSLPIFALPALAPRRAFYLYQLLHIWCLSYYYKVVRRTRGVPLSKIFQYWRWLAGYQDQLAGYRLKMIGAAAYLTWRLMVDVLKSQLAE